MSQLSNNQFSFETAQKPQLCRVCCEFFGNKDSDYLCSKCFKSTQTKKNDTQSATLAVSNIFEQVVQPISSTMEEEKEESAQKVQHDHKKCFNCSKKVGSLGWKCKCGFTYCKGHRLPEDHKCDFNFREEGIQRLAKENPVVQASKLAKI